MNCHRLIFLQSLLKRKTNQVLKMKTPCFNLRFPICLGLRRKTIYKVLYL